MQSLSFLQSASLWGGAFLVRANKTLGVVQVPRSPFVDRVNPRGKRAKILCVSVDRLSQVRWKITKL